MMAPQHHNPSTILELSFRATHVPKTDYLSQSDPMVIVYEVVAHSGALKELGRTEFIRNDAHPKFQKKIRFDYFFEKIQNLKFYIIDIDDEKTASNNELKNIKHTQIAVIDLQASHLVCSLNGISKYKIPQPSGRDSPGGELICEARNLNRAETLRLRLSGKDLDKKDFFGKSDPFVRIYRFDCHKKEILVAETSYVKKTLNPLWSVIEIPLGHLIDYNEDYIESPIKLVCLDWNRFGDPDLIGSCFTTLKQLLIGGSTLQLINEDKAKRSKTGNSGKLVVCECKIEKTWSFFDYLQGGLEISAAIAIDFTGSNGHPLDNNSLHNVNSFNPYMSAISQVGHIISCYDKDKAYPVYGFGAFPPNQPKVSHAFHVNFNDLDPHVYGVEGVLQAYKNCIQQVTFSGPTYFAPVINNFLNAIEKTQTRMSYYILLIITDGCINDLSQTKSTLLRASQLPLSIIIVGVGNADFSAMHELDNDALDMVDERSGLKIPRDIVQFVEMRNFGNERGESLAEEVLYEVPAQLLDYMSRNNIEPNVTDFGLLQGL